MFRVWLGNTSFPPRRAEGCGQAEGGLGVSTQTAASVNWILKRECMDV